MQRKRGAPQEEAPLEELRGLSPYFAVEASWAWRMRSWHRRHTTTLSPSTPSSFHPVSVWATTVAGTPPRPGPGSAVERRSLSVWTNE